MRIASGPGLFFDLNPPPCGIRLNIKAFPVRLGPSTTETFDNLTQWHTDDQLIGRRLLASGSDLFQSGSTVKISKKWEVLF